MCQLHMWHDSKPLQDGSHCKTAEFVLSYEPFRNQMKEVDLILGNVRAITEVR